jgi:poly-gamma-glutamate capsule biosynthesis protein CapA/YwtB (metallophosphatase superfamily)
MRRRTFLRAMAGTLVGAPLAPALLPALVRGAEIAPALLEPPLPPVSGQRTVRLMAVGDIMTHMSIVRGARQQDGSYDFSPIFRDVAPVFAQADWVLGNLETRLAGIERGYRGFPLFNAPDALAPALAGAGFTLLSTANNHCMDMGAPGVERTNAVLAEHGLLQAGTYATEQEAGEIAILEKNGVRLAVLAYANDTNGLPIPRDKPWMVKLIDLPAMAADIRQARERGADFVAMFPHFGVEYSRRPSLAQQRLVAALLEHGADLVLGSHPHVAQPLQSMHLHGADRAVIYSMGNFLANQLKRHTYLGAIFSVELSLDDKGTRRLRNVTALPTKIVRHAQGHGRGYRVLPIQHVLDNREASGLGKAELAQLERDLEEMTVFLGSMPVG